MEEMHPDLFTALRSQHISDVLAQTTPTLPQENISSFHVAQFFYSLCQKYPEIKKKFFTLVPSGLE